MPFSIPSPVIHCQSFQALRFDVNRIRRLFEESQRKSSTVAIASFEYEQPRDDIRVKLRNEAVFRSEDDIRVFRKFRIVAVQYGAGHDSLRKLRRGARVEAVDFDFDVRLN